MGVSKCAPQAFIARDDRQETLRVEVTMIHCCLTLTLMFTDDPRTFTPTLTLTSNLTFILTFTLILAPYLSPRLSLVCRSL